MIQGARQRNNLIPQAEQLQTTRINSPCDLAPHLDAWRELASGTPMRTPEWLLGWWANFAAPDDELSVLLLSAPGDLIVGVAPLYLQGSGGSRTLRILGAANNCTHHSAWLCATGWETQVGISVARFLLNCRPEWKRVLLEAIDADAVAILATVNYLAENDCLLHRRPINSCWKIALPATWDDYLAGLSRSLRKRCKKLQREFFDSGQIQVRQAQSEEDLREGLRILLNLHGSRWGDAKNPLGVFTDQRFRNFHETVARELLDRQQLRLAWLECAGRPLAVEYQFFDANTVYAYQAGIDLAMDEYSPGKLTMMAAIQFAIARGCSCFDLLGGDEPYKANWRAVPISCHDLRIWPKRGRGAVEWGLWTAYMQVIQLLKPWIPPRLVEWAIEFFRAVRGGFGIFRRSNR